MTDRDLLDAMFRAAVTAADPETALRAHLPDPPKGRTVVVGAGKGAAHLGAAFERLWEEDVSGVIVTRHGFAVPCQRLQVIEAAHPVPDAAGIVGAQALLDAVSGLGSDDLVVALVTGGGSALLPRPAQGLTFDDEVALNQALLASGAPIGVMNTIRGQISGIKAGRLAAAAHPARVVSLVVSDVPGDDPAEVASGPTVPSPRRRADALEAVADWRIALPPAIRRHLEMAPDDTPDPADAAFARDEVNVIASASRSLDAASHIAERKGLSAVILSDAIEGEARDVGRVLGALAREVRLRNRPFNSPVVILSGGETTVTIRGQGGRGGRNTECLLAFADAIDGLDGITAIAADTDGIDGTEDNAGAFADGTTAARLRAKGRSAQGWLSENDAWGAFSALDDLYMTGPTGTNVNDFRAIIVR